MGNILNTLGQVIAIIDENGKVHPKDRKDILLGYVNNNGDVYDKGNNKVGEVEENGYVYRGSDCIGTVYTTGEVRNYDNQSVGKVTGDHINEAGAVLILLLLG